MSIFGDAIRRGGRGRLAAAGRAAGPPASAPSPARELPRDATAQSELRRRRDALAEEVTELHWDLGGLAYEMAIRDHFRLDVLMRRAALLQERDAQLAEVERLLRMEEGAVAGDCPHCRAPHSRGALYCWQCGVALMSQMQSSTAAGKDGARAAGETPTAVMDALLAPDAGGEQAALGSDRRGSAGRGWQEP